MCLETQASVLITSVWAGRSPAPCLTWTLQPSRHQAAALMSVPRNSTPFIFCFMAWVNVCRRILTCLARWKRSLRQGPCACGYSGRRCPCSDVRLCFIKGDDSLSLEVPAASDSAIYYALYIHDIDILQIYTVKVPGNAAAGLEKGQTNCYWREELVTYLTLSRATGVM